jgi:hypothetical protein
MQFVILIFSCLGFFKQCASTTAENKSYVVVVVQLDDNLA